MQLEHDNVLPRFSSEYLIQSRETLETALYRTRAYAAWRELDPGPEADIEARYAALPWLTKQDIRNHFPDGFTPSDRDVEKGLASGEISFVSTSGTTDEVVTNIWNQKWWNASEKASWALHAVTASLSYENHSEAILASALSVGKLSDTKRLSSVERTIGHLHFLNECSTPLLWDEALLRRIVLELNTMQPEVLEANPSYLSRFCRFVAREGIEVKNPHVIVLTYELPTPLQLAQITEVFSCPVVSSYGSTETAYVFMECEAGRFHQNSEFCRIDFSPLPSQDGTSLLGRIAVTTFGNPWFYLLRFDIGDLVRLEPSGRCPCGRHSGYILSSIEGRLKGATYTAEGLLVTQAEAGRALSQISGIDDFQILQEAQDCFTVSVEAPRIERATEESIIEAMKALYGKNANVSVQAVSAILPGASGKYQTVKL